MKCVKCNTEFSIWAIIEGKTRNLCSRKRCLKCSPFGLRNTSVLNPRLNESDPKGKDRKRECIKRIYAERRQEFFKGKQCAVCGSLVDLQLDHIDPTTKVKETDHNIWMWGKQRREIELVKCQVLCATHHQSKTAAERRKPVVHGTCYGYERDRCRCQACVAAKSRYNKEYRARIKVI